MVVTMLQLYHNDMSVCAQKVRFVLAFKALDWEGPNFNLRAGEQFNPDFLRLSPKGLVPVLVHDGSAINESNAIIEYLEEVFPQPALMPDDAVLRAKIRRWMIQLDAGLHEQVAVISFCVAFRHQLLQRYPTAESLAAFLEQIPDPERAAVMRDIVINGMESPRLALAVYAYDSLLREIDRSLEDSDFLVGENISLADCAYLPYIERLEQLQLGAWWKSRPRIDHWLHRLRRLPAYTHAIANWHNATYLEQMRDLGTGAWERVSALAIQA